MSDCAGLSWYGWCMVGGHVLRTGALSPLWKATQNRLRRSRPPILFIFFKLSAKNVGKANYIIERAVLFVVVVVAVFYFFSFFAHAKKKSHPFLPLARLFLPPFLPPYYINTQSKPSTFPPPFLCVMPPTTRTYADQNHSLIDHTHPLSFHFCS